MKGDYTANSHYLTYTFLFERLGECSFLDLGVKGLKKTKFFNLYNIKTEQTHSIFSWTICQVDLEDFFPGRGGRV